MIAALAPLSFLAQSATGNSFDVPANVVFYIVAAFMVFAAIRVVTTDNIVHAALWLILVPGIVLFLPRLAGYEG